MAVTVHNNKYQYNNFKLLIATTPIKNYASGPKKRNEFIHLSILSIILRKQK